MHRIASYSCLPWHGKQLFQIPFSKHVTRQEKRREGHSWGGIPMIPCSNPQGDGWPDPAGVGRHGTHAPAPGGRRWAIKKNSGSTRLLSRNKGGRQLSRRAGAVVDSTSRSRTRRRQWVTTTSTTTTRAPPNWRTGKNLWATVRLRSPAAAPVPVESRIRGPCWRRRRRRSAALRRAPIGPERTGRHLWPLVFKTYHKNQKN